MALVVADRIKETTTTSGTGTITLAGSTAGFRSFADIGNGNTTYYSIVDSAAGTWEVGIGTYTAIGTTLSRDTVLSNSLGTTAKINFSANLKDVFVTYPADKALYYQDVGGVVVSENSSVPAVRITQTGSGNALVVEDSANPDSTPFVIDASGRVNVGGTAWYSIGSVTPANQFNGAGTIASLGLNSWQAGVNVQSRIYFNRADSATQGDFSDAVDSGDNLGSIHWTGSDGTAFIEAASINAAVDGTPGTNDMPGRLVFSTTADGASSPTERMRIDSAGRLLLGTTATGARVNISANSTEDALRITQTGSGNALVVEDSANPDASPFVVDANGNVLKGITTVDTTTPVSTSGTGVMVSSNGASGSTLTQLTWNTGFSTAPYIQLGKSNSATVGTRGVVTSGQLLGRIAGIGDDGTNFVNAAFIDVAVDGTPGTNDMPGRLVFSTTADGASTPTERMRINNAGNVGIGTSSPSYKLQVSGDAAAKQVTATNGIFVNSNTVTESYSIPSNNNAMSAGEITIASGVTVTVPSGSRWAIV
jgi:hypothetical protein